MRLKLSLHLSLSNNQKLYDEKYFAFTFFCEISSGVDADNGAVTGKGADQAESRNLLRAYLGIDRIDVYLIFILFKKFS